MIEDYISGSALVSKKLTTDFHATPVAVPRGESIPILLRIGHGQLQESFSGSQNSKVDSQGKDK